MYVIFLDQLKYFLGSEVFYILYFSIADLDAVCLFWVDSYRSRLLCINVETLWIGCCFRLVGWCLVIKSLRRCNNVYISSARSKVSRSDVSVHCMLMSVGLLCDSVRHKFKEREKVIILTLYGFYWKWFCQSSFVNDSSLNPSLEPF